MGEILRDWDVYSEDGRAQDLIVNDLLPSLGRSRRLLCPVQTGHTLKLFLLTGEEALMCIPCHERCSVKHLLKCMDTRNHFFKMQSN